MNLHQILLRKHTLIILLTFLCSNLQAVKPKKTNNNPPKKELREQKRSLTLKQKTSLALVQKRAARKAKRSTQENSVFKRKGLAPLSILLGLLGIVFIPITIAASVFVIFYPTLIVSCVLGILAIVFARISQKRIKSNPEKYTGKGLAFTGLIFGALVLGFWSLILLLWLDLLGFLLPLFG